MFICLTFYQDSHFIINYINSVFIYFLIKIDLNKNIFSTKF